MKWRLPVAVLAALLPGPLGRMLMRSFLGFEIQKDVSIGLGTIIYAERVRLERGARIGRFCRIKAHHLDLDRASEISDSVRLTVHTAHLHARSIIGKQVVFSGDSTDSRSILTMGMHSWIFQECFVDVTREVKLGRNVGIGGRSEVFTHGYWLSALEGYPVAKGAVTFGNDVWIPWSCFILPGAHLGSGVVVGARSVVGGHIADGSLAAGIPAKVIRNSARRPISEHDQNQVLRDITEDLASTLRRNYEESPTSAWIDLLIDGQRYIRIQLAPDSSALASDCLNIVRVNLPEGTDAALQWLSLESSVSSDFRYLSDRTLQWLRHSRKWGVRFYPKDEYARYNY